jgi:DNA-binding protein H-NS
MDISTLGLADLKLLLREIPREIKRREAAERSKVRRQLEALAQEHGFSLSEILSESAPRSKRGGTAEIKYRHPQNPADAWSGRGRKPRWVETWLANGGTLDQLKV